MADSILPVPLNLGLDLVTPPLMIEPGSLISCLNYEMTDTAGYRRIDGYEQYDGYPNGDLNEYYVVGLSSTATIEVGAVLYRATTSGVDLPIGVVVGDNGNGTYAIVVYRTPLDFVFEPQFLSLSDGVGLLLLSNGNDALLINGEGVTLTDNFYMIYGGVTTEITVTSIPSSGSNVATDAETYLNNLRQYSAALRAGVLAAPGVIAGLYWFEDRLLVAINTLRLLGSSAPAVNTRVLWDGNVYVVVATSGASGGNFNIYVRPTGETNATVSNTIQGINLAGTIAGSYGTANPESTAEASDASSEWAYLGYFNNPTISVERGFTYLTPGQTFPYNNGSLAGTLPPTVTLDGSSYYYVVGDAGATVLKVKLTSVNITSGTFNTNNAVGKSQIEVVEVVSGTRDYLISGDEIHNVYPTTASSNIMDVTGNSVPALLAGTAKLDRASSRYVWGSYNFYGQSSSLTAYGATGASRAFWATKSGYGTITAIADSMLDTPRYMSFHAGKLALAYQKGSVLLSVIGEPYNFQGVDGALEIATGDDITGLLETPGATLTVFGRTSIRKITGTTDQDTVLGTISGNSGAFDYTAVLVGANAVFAGLNGISTLEQTAAYGDFVGQRVSANIGAWLRPKLASSYLGFEQGGAACAFPVRSKSQYRLVLRTGEVVVVTFTEGGPKLTISNWTTSGNLPRIPYAWSSEVSNDNKEKIFVRWEGSSLEKQVFQLDSGWGFNGLTFNHHFTTAHIFNKQGSMFMGVEKIRMYGQGHGVASLNIKSSGIEDDFEQDYHETIQDISMPPTVTLITGQMRPVTSIIDQANWGLGIKLKIQGSNGENTALTEPSHICQVFVLHTRTDGATDG